MAFHSTHLVSGSIRPKQMIRRANVNAYFIEKSERKSSFELEVAKKRGSVGKGKLSTWRSAIVPTHVWYLRQHRSVFQIV